MRKEFESVLRAKVSDSGNFTLHIERAMNGEEWLATKAELEKVIVKQRVKSTDYATDSSSPVRAGQIRVEYGPVKGQRYFPGLFAKIRNKKLNPRDLIALGRVEDEKVQLVLGDSEGRTRTMDVDNLRSPYLLEVISEPEEPALTDEQFARLAKDRINDLAGIGADD